MNGRTGKIMGQLTKQLSCSFSGEKLPKINFTEINLDMKKLRFWHTGVFSHKY